jgi:hypothetical protein
MVEKFAIEPNSKSIKKLVLAAGIIAMFGNSEQGQCTTNGFRCKRRGKFYRCIESQRQ